MKKTEKVVTRGVVLQALREKFGPSGHVCRVGGAFHAETFGPGGRTRLTSSTGGWEGLLKAVRTYRR